MPGPWNNRGAHGPNVPGAGAAKGAGLMRNPAAGAELGALLAQGDFQSVVVRIAIVTRVLQESVLATGSAPGAREGVYVRYRVQVGEGVLQDGTPAVKGGRMRLIVITQAVHLPAPISYIGDRKHGVTCQLNLGTKAGLFHVTRPLVRILGTELELRQIESRPHDRSQWEAILQLKDSVRPTLVQLHVKKERRVQLDQAFRSNAVAMLIENSITAAPDEAIRQLVSKTQTRCKIVPVGMNQRTVKPTGGVTCGRHDSPAVGRRKVCSIVFPLHDG